MMEKPMRKTLACVILAMLFASGAATGQSDPSGAATSQGVDVTPGATIVAGHFVRASRPHQWRASKLIGLDVYGSEDEKVGEIVEILIDKDGNEVVVLGIGGFLGIARREIAIPFTAVDWRFGAPPRPKSADTSNPAPSTTAETGARKTIDNTRRGYPDFAFVAATKDSLKAAPEFTYESGEPPTSNAPQAR
jgi:sporulation protein YlmC with PRC-barrel domain